MKSVQSEEARRNFRAILNEVEHDGEHVEIQRYQVPAAVMVPPDWYRRTSAIVDAVRAFTHDSDGHRLPGESELPVGELLRLIGDAAIKDLEAGQ